MGPSPSGYDGSHWSAEGHRRVGELVRERLRELVAANGLGWTMTFAAERLLAALASRLDRRLAALEERRGLPGINGVERNYRQWNSRDWSDGGEAWTQSSEWKQSLIDEVM